MKLEILKRRRILVSLLSFLGRKEATPFPISYIIIASVLHCARQFNSHLLTGILKQGPDCQTTVF